MPSRPQFGEAAPPPLPLVLRETTPHDRGKVRRDQKLLVVGVAASGAVTAAIAFLVVLLLLYRRLRGGGRIQKTNSFEVPNSVVLRRFSYRDLKAATRSFSDAQKLGQGGFGVVYHGRLAHSGQEIAVKVLDATSLHGEREFLNEVSVVGKVSSPHIVGLLGFCADRKRGRRLLVYEYMQNRSLQDALFDEGYGVQLGWGERFRIIMDTAKALAFLHGECEPAIIHGDIKPSNILLDGDFRARIADFGLARFKVDVASAGGEAELRAERERRSENTIREHSVISTTKRENDQAAKVNADGDFKVNEEDSKAKADVNVKINGGDSKANADGDLKVNEEAASKATADRDLKINGGGDSKVNADGNLKINGGGDSKATADGDLKINEEAESKATADGDLKIDEGGDSKVNADGDLKINEGGDSKVIADGDLKINGGGDSKANEDADQRSVGTMQSPETFVSNSPTQENVIFMSSNAASPEGLHYDTDTVTDTQEENTPSEIVDLEKSRRRDRTVDCKSVDFSRDDDDRMSLSECFEKASLDSGRPGGSLHPGRRKKGKDWWRWQDTSGELSVKDYVMEWIGSEIKKDGPKSSWRAEESERDSNLGSSSRRTGKKKHRRKESLEWWAALAEENKENKKKEKPKSKGREWWREEYCEELSNKGGKLKSKSGEWWNTEEEEMKKGWWRSKSVSRDWWSGEDHQPHYFNGGGGGGGGDYASGISSTPSTRGTVCYIAPECGGAGVVSEKSDVYSFGVVMLVVISGRRPLQVMASPITELERANLISWVRHLARASKVLELVDGALGGAYDRDQALLCITVALLCLQRLPAARPSMCHVVQFLSGEMEAPPLPVEFSPSPPYGVPFRSRRKSSRTHLHTNGHRHEKHATTLTQ